MNTTYTNEKNIQILISLLKQSGIKRIIVSPGMTNASFVASIQKDSFFEIYSVVDERSAAYMACGLSAETEEPVVISCTGATASRNYIPGLTEAYYRKLPVLAITSSQPSSRIGHLIPQVTDRSAPMPDTVKFSTELPLIKDDEDYWMCITRANRAINELRKNGGGPVHINLITDYNYVLNIERLPEARLIKSISLNDKFPQLMAKHVAIFVGSHLKWDEELELAVDEFCEKYNGVVLCDNTSNYEGKYRIIGNLVANQEQMRENCCFPELVIHIGEVSGAYMRIEPQKVWRVNLDGEIRDPFKKLEYIFEMRELDFFNYYNSKRDIRNETTYYMEWKKEYEFLYEKIPEIDFSNLWIAWKTIPQLPSNSVIHFGILNSLRCWNYFELPQNVYGYSNVGGFGIDGVISTTIGASFNDLSRIYFCILGDLAFFYDLNSLGNRHINSNLRVMVVNNERGFEFRHYSSFPVRKGLSGNFIDEYIAAGGHHGDSYKTVKDLAENWGFKYISAANKEEYLSALPVFISPESVKQPIIFEVFTTVDCENHAQYTINNLSKTLTGTTKELIKKVIGEKNINKIKNLNLNK